VPTILARMMSDPDPRRADRVLQAVMGMNKLDIKELKAAYGRR
jgi:predicted 3-demethylubiquinone-9 3-methyltransferase (glyoxalase superfamily)